MGLNYWGMSDFRLERMDFDELESVLEVNNVEHLFYKDLDDCDSEEERKKFKEFCNL